MTDSKSQSVTRFDPIAGILALVLPGLGHFYLKERARAVWIAVGVFGLFFGGIFIGGIDVVDSREDRVWFMLTNLPMGPTVLVVDWLHQNRFKVIDDGRLRSAWPGETRGADGRVKPAIGDQPPPNIKSIGRTNEIGTLFCALGGFLNLIVIVDAAFRTEVER